MLRGFSWFGSWYKDVGLFFKSWTTSAALVRGVL